MQDLVNLQEKIRPLSELALLMLRNTFSGFMEHNLDILANVLKDEERLNEMERSATMYLVSLSKDKISKSQRKTIMLLTYIVADLEEIGDYIKDMIERIEIKIREKLLFSEEALKEYRHLYNVAESDLSNIDMVLETDDFGFAKRVTLSEKHTDKLVKKYRQAHAQRLISGVCDPRGGSMFLNLLDFMLQISHRLTAIGKNLLELK